MSYLEKIVIRLPDEGSEFKDRLQSLISSLGNNENGLFRFDSSGKVFFPKIYFDYKSKGLGFIAEFITSEGDNISVKLENTTGINKKSPFSYKPIEIQSVVQRLTNADISFSDIDHVGINLPWFSQGSHPIIQQLRENLALRCLYHEYPTGEPWDFIPPGEIDEIHKNKEIDYSIVRRPKFELVSFDNSSKPLIQIDVGIDVEYDKFSLLFPESLKNPELRQLWIYLESPYSIDICLVLSNISKEDDWSEYFKGHRI